jgi:cGMP-dependent 3',5'-cyclic phosphodiesterase
MLLKRCTCIVQDYEKVLDLMREIILATDLGHHLRIIKDLEKMAEGL